MRLLRTITPIILLLFFASCTDKKSKSHERNYTSAELLGKWNQIGTDMTLNDTDSKIEYIHLVNDSVAEVHLIDQTGKRKVSGRWKNKFKKEIKMANLKIGSDVSITYLPDDNQSYMLLLKLSEENKKLIMTARNYKFEKE